MVEKKRIKRRTFLGKCLTVVGSSVLMANSLVSCSGKANQKSTRPNIIYFVCHDLGKHVGCYGAKVPSPNIDRFAADGVKFTNAFCNSCCCSPSRGCAMTGQYAHNNGLMGLVNRGWSLPEEKKTIVDYLNADGYETVHFGLQHERYKAEANRYQIEGHTCREDDLVERAIDKAIQYLENRAESNKPFYLNVGTIEVHCSRWHGTFPEDRSDVYGIDPPDKVYMPDYIPDVPQLRDQMGRFQGAIRFLDKHVQRLFEAVEQLGYSENTLVVFTTDHGISNMRAKMWLYDRGVEITLLMKMPGTIGEGIEIPDLIQNIDVAPTILEAAGVEIPESMQGKSFWKRLTGGDYQSQQAVFTERNWHGNNYDPMRAVRTNQYHYIKNFGEKPKKAWTPHEIPYMNETFKTWHTDLWPPLSLPRDREELYDVVNDPEEFVNLAYDLKYQDIKKTLAEQLDTWMHDTNDPLLDGPIPDKLCGWPSGQKE